jgi:thioesterase domain-containing protein/acyl carrier protein
VKIRGVRIELGEIEAALAEVRGVRSAAVVTREDQTGDKRLLAYVVADQEGPNNDYKIRSLLSQRLPAYLVPSRFIFLERLPLTPNGKLDRSALPDPENILPSGNDGILPQRNSVEIQLTQVWQTELQMTELWKSVLGKESLELTDNFFDLGGHSLLALHLSGLIEQRFGMRLPPAALFQAPTIAQLSEMIHRRVASGRQPSLIAIQSRGSRPPFFCVHAMGGTVFSYIDLAQSLPADQPFYGLQSQGYGEEDPLGRIEDMAARYIEEMRGVQPEGPYLVGGWSMGGVVAYEIAQQLVAAGQNVGLLAMFDSGTPNEDPDTHPEDDEAFSFKLLELIAQTVGLSWDGYRHFIVDEQLKHLLEIAGVSKSADGTLPEESLAEARRHMRVIQNNMRAVAMYSPSTYPGRITLFRATGPDEAHWAEEADQTLGWNGLAGGGVDIHLVSGTHESMVNPPHVADLAHQLDACIQSALAREGR